MYGNLYGFRDIISIIFYSFQAKLCCKTHKVRRDRFQPMFWIRFGIRFKFPKKRGFIWQYFEKSCFSWFSGYSISLNRENWEILRLHNVYPSFSNSYKVPYIEKKVSSLHFEIFTESSAGAWTIVISISYVCYLC